MIDTLWWLFNKFSGYIKYSLVGLVGAVIHFPLLYWLTDYVHMWYIASATISMLCAATSNYILNYLWTFKDRKGSINNLFIGWLKFLVPIGILDVIYLGLLYLFTDIFGVYYMVSAFVAVCFITVVGYLISSRWIWKKKLENKVVKASKLELRVKANGG